jgi:radical SAM protein with 4Fe4S-binding SPASM domain
MPLSYSIEPTNYCNLKCPECPSGTGELTRQLGFLSLENFQQIINQISDTGFYIQLFFQGEPYLNKKLGEMINYAQQKNVYVSVSTNANLITQRNITSLMENAPDKIIFSLDGLDEESYQKYRVGGTFQKADDALKLLVQEKRKLKMRKPFIELQFIVMKQNEHLLQEVKSYSSLRGVDRVVFKTMKVSSVKNAVEFLPANNKYSRYTIKDGDLKIKGKQLNHCFALWRTAVITWDKRMVPCCFDKDANYSLGDLSENSISEIWHSTPYQKFRQNILNNRKGINICNNCTEGIKVNIFHMEN